MERSTSPSQCSIRTHAPLLQVYPSKPLPPVPTYLRRSSSVYSGKSAWSLEEHDPLRDRLYFAETYAHSMVFDHNELNLARPNLEPGSLCFLEPKTYVPPSAKLHAQRAFPISSIPSQSSSGDNDSLLLSKGCHILNESVMPNASEKSVEDYSQPQYSSTPGTEFFEDDHETFYSQKQGAHPLHTLEPSPMTSAIFSEGQEFPGFQLYPNQHVTRIEKPAHKRIASQEKALIAMGIDSNKLKDEADHRAHRYKPLHKTQRYSSKRAADLPTATEETRSCEMPLLMTLSRDSSSSFVDGETNSESDSVDSQIFARDYHEHLTSQSRNEKLSKGPYANSSMKAAARMMPAPLFFQKSAEKYKHNMADKDEPGNTNDLFGRSSKKQGTPPNTLTYLLNSAMDKAKEGFSSMASATHSDEESFTGRKTAQRGRDIGEKGSRRRKSSGQKRRDELKGRIRIVGHIDPAAAALADRLGAVELGRLNANVKSG